MVLSEKTAGDELNSRMASFLEASNHPSGKDLPRLREELRKSMGLDETNFSAFMVLYDSFKNPQPKTRVEIFSHSGNTPGRSVAYPTAIAPKDILAKLPFVSYANLLSRLSEFKPLATRTTLWVKKMQAGTGSTVVRDDYLQAARANTGETLKIGAKGTDLYASVANADGTVVQRALAELQVLQLLRAEKQNEFGEIVFQDLVSTETEEALERIWAKEPSAKRFEKFVQAQVPSLDESQKLSLNRTAPSGHWIFAVDALRAALHDRYRPKSNCEHLVAAIGNGEDLSSTPDPAMVGWMLKEKIPIVMVTTEKTSNDLKGGQISLVEDHVSIIEQAQAKEAGQLELFEQLGVTVKNDDQIAFFNTNMALFNYEVLVPQLQALATEIGEHAFLDLLAPDLIMNWKEQTDDDGMARKYLQIEGAMGSSLLNFDRYWRRRFGKPLVHFINVESQFRTQFFSPIKTAFDYFMQFHSDKFHLNPKTFRLESRGKSGLPLINLKDEETKDQYYADVSNILTGFEGTAIGDLESLNISGKVSARGMVLSGKVVIENHLNEVVNVASMTLRETGGRTLRNQKLVVDSRGRPTVTEL